jgi:RNA polymerase sigma factor (sigma-70 family)
MTDVPDARLLEQFARNGSEEAFAALVQRHIALVHSMALRHTANPQHAQDITQAVFVILARKAGSLGRRTVLPGWLYHTARLTAANLQRAETSRFRREQEAYMQSQLEESVNDALWRELSPQLDEAMAGLGASERDALVLRYFQNQSMAEVGQFLGLAENTAQKRVSRALEKLRAFFVKRGLDSTTSAIAENISANSVQAVPVALVKSVTAVAVAKGATASTSTLTLIKGALKLMAWTKAKTAVVAGVVVLLAAGTTTITVKEIKAHRPQIWQAGFDMSVLDRVPPQATILPALRSRDPNINSWRGRDGDGKIMGLNDSATKILSAAYNVPRARMIFLSPIPDGKYDFISNVPKNQRQALQQAIRKEFGLVGNYQLVRTNALELVVRKPAVGLKRSVSAGPEFSGANGFVWLSNQPIATLAISMNTFLKLPWKTTLR